MRVFFAIASILFLFWCCSCVDTDVNEQKLLGKTKDEVIEYCFNDQINRGHRATNISVVSKNGGTEHLSFCSKKEAKTSEQLKKINVWDVLGVKIWGGYRYYRIEFINNKVFNIKQMKVTDF